MTQDDDSTEEPVFKYDAVSAYPSVHWVYVPRKKPPFIVRYRAFYLGRGKVGRRFLPRYKVYVPKKSLRKLDEDIRRGNSEYGKDA